MFKRYSMLFSLIILIGCIMVLTSVQRITERNFDDYKTSYEVEVGDRLTTYLDDVKRDLLQAIESNAYWTEAVERLGLQDDEWLDENATTYIIEMALFSTDYILITDEKMNYTQESGGTYKDVLLNDEHILDTLNNNTVNYFYKEVNDELLLVVSSPFLDNELDNPTGLYICVKRIDNSFFETLQEDVFEELLEIILSYNDENNLMDNEIVELYTRYDLQGTDRYLEMKFDLSKIYDMLFVQRNHLIVSIAIVAATVAVLISIVIFVLVKRIKIITNGVEMISQGDYDYEIPLHHSKCLLELNQLSDDVNRMSHDIKEHIEVIDNSYNEMVNVIINAVEINDAYTSRHNVDVGKYSKIIAEEIHFHNVDDLILASKLHDIGKISIPGYILNKPSKLTKEEFEIIKIHPLKGYQIIEHLDYFEEIKLGVKYHHEKYDGTGYPEGLKGDEIPIMAQIISISDVYDAVTSDRSYRKGLSHQEAIKIITDGSGSQFNPMLVEAFMARSDDFRVLMMENRARVF